MQKLLAEELTTMFSALAAGLLATTLDTMTGRSSPPVRMTPMLWPLSTSTLANWRLSSERPARKIRVNARKRSGRRTPAGENEDLSSMKQSYTEGASQIHAVQPIGRTRMQQHSHNIDRRALKRRRNIHTSRNRVEGNATWQNDEKRWALTFRARSLAPRQAIPT
jgi:hypothetical protein